MTTMTEQAADQARMEAAGPAPLTPPNRGGPLSRRSYAPAILGAPVIIRRVEPDDRPGFVSYQPGLPLPVTRGNSDPTQGMA